LYSGEQFDSKIGQQYLRQRYYDPATGRFNRLDPFFGNLNDPQSLQKYLYTHADPVNGIDPSGLLVGGGFGGGSLGGGSGVMSTQTRSTTNKVGGRIAYDLQTIETGAAVSQSVSVMTRLYQLTVFSLITSMVSAPILTAYQQTLPSPLHKSLAKKIGVPIKTHEDVTKIRNREQHYLYFVHGTNTNRWKNINDIVEFLLSDQRHSNTDFGRGFYNFRADMPGFNKATKWAIRGSQYGGEPFLLVTRILSESYRDLKKKYYTNNEEYFTHVNQYRHGIDPNQGMNFDVIVGPTATEMEKGSGIYIAMPDFPEQYVFKTVIGCNQLEYVAYIPLSLVGSSVLG
jgi:RHS repeat-associated protein